MSSECHEDVSTLQVCARGKSELSVSGYLIKSEHSALPDKVHNLLLKHQENSSGYRLPTVKSFGRN